MATNTTSNSTKEANADQKDEHTSQSASHKRRHPAAPVKGFVGFLREHAIVGLAVGFVLGTQVQTVVKQLISSFIDPMFQLIFPGDKTLSARTFTLHFDKRHANFGWGALAYDIIDFLFVAMAVYIIIKVFRLDKLDQPKI